MSTKKIILILGVIILLGLGLRLSAVLASQSFWFDEIVSLKIAEKGLVESWQYLAWENNPPLHYWFLHFWIALVGTSEVAVRLSSVLFAGLNLLLFYLLAKDLFGRLAGLLAAFMAAMSSFQLFLSMDARMYQLVLACGLLSVLFFWKSLWRPRARFILPFVVFSLAALYTHLTASVLILAEFLYLFLSFRRRPAFKPLFFSFLGIATLFVPWLTVFALHSLTRLTASAWYLNTPPGVFLPAEILFSQLFLAARMKYIDFFAWCALGILFLAAPFEVTNWSVKLKSVCLKISKSESLVFCLIVISLPLGFGFLLDIWVSKYYWPATIGLYPLLAFGASKFCFKRQATILVCLFLAGLFIPHDLWIIQNQGKHQWRNVANYAQTIERERDVVFLSAFVYQPLFKYYYRGNAPVIDFEPPGLETDELLKIVKYNWYALIDENNSPDLSVLLSGFDRAIVIYPSISAQIHRADLVMQWFADNGWRIESQKKFGGFVRPEVIVFDRPD